MHDCDYRNISGLGLVYDPKWKPLHETSPDSTAAERTTNAWMDKNFGQGAFELPNKVRTQARGASFVEPGGCDKFASGQRVKDESHRSAARAFFNTFPAGMPVSLPPLSSAERQIQRRIAARPTALLKSHGIAWCFLMDSDSLLA
jgi:hypothetical protein